MNRLTIAPRANPVTLPPKTLEQHLVDMESQVHNELEGLDDGDEFDGQIVADDAADIAFLEAMESVRSCGLLS